jgi:hypothetical protein
MVAYEFYWRDPKKGYQHIGTLPERRKNPTRITQESVMKWGEVYFANRDCSEKSYNLLKSKSNHIIF